MTRLRGLVPALALLALAGCGDDAAEAPPIAPVVELQEPAVDAAAVPVLEGAAVSGRPPLAQPAPVEPLSQGPDPAALVASQRDRWVALAQRVWELAELGYLEQESSASLQAELRRAGFRVETGVAGIPTAFTATWGDGGPVLGLLAEFDALPGLSQAAVAQRQPVVEGAPGHACGHHLFGAASVAAAVAVKEWLQATGTPGTVRLYGTPAEEGGSGKVYMARAGLFDGVDAVLHWHPSDRNTAAAYSSNGNKSGRFTFHGVAAHAASAPEKGRSALDGVEAMNHMANMLHEHTPEAARIHYVITDGGDAPNIVPETAQVYYYVRHPQAAEVDALFARVVQAAEGAAIGTGTAMDLEVMHGNWPLLPNETLARVLDRHLNALGGVQWSAAERAFAERLRETLVQPDLPLDSAAEVQPFRTYATKGSTDVGDVSWLVPTVGLRTATWVPGTAAHSWQAVAAGGTGIGHKGMLLAAQVLARSAVDLVLHPAVLAEAQAELQRRRGPDFSWQPLLGDRDPPLDYRR